MRGGSARRSDRSCLPPALASWRAVVVISSRWYWAMASWQGAAERPPAPWLGRAGADAGLAGRGCVARVVPGLRYIFLPSAGEGIALVLYEAMACGMAIVAADVGGHAELVSAHCGFLVPRRDAEREARDYAARLESLMREPEMLRRMGQNSARRIREEFTLSLFERRLRELLERVPVSTPCGVCTDSPVPGLGRPGCPCNGLPTDWQTDCAAGWISRSTAVFQDSWSDARRGVLLAHIRGEGALAKDQEALNE